MIPGQHACTIKSFENGKWNHESNEQECPIYERFCAAAWLRALGAACTLVLRASDSKSKFRTRCRVGQFHCA